MSRTRARHDHLHDSGGAIADFQPHHIAHPLLMGQVHRPAIMSESEKALMNNVERGPGSEPFHHGGLHGVRSPGVAQSQGVVRELPACGELRLTLDERKGHALELCDWTTKGLTLPGIGPGFVHRSLSCANALKRYQRAAIIEATHDLREPFAFGAEAMIGRNTDSVEEHRSPPGHVTADIFEARALESVRIAGDKKCGDTLCAVACVTDPGEHDERVRAIRKSRGRLLTIQQVMISIASRP